MSNNTVIMYLTRREAERFLKHRNHALTTFLGGVVVGSVGAVAGAFGLVKVKNYIDKKHIDEKRYEDSFRFDNEI